MWLREGFEMETRPVLGIERGIQTNQPLARNNDTFSGSAGDRTVSGIFRMSNATQNGSTGGTTMTVGSTTGESHHSDECETHPTSLMSAVPYPKSHETDSVISQYDSSSSVCPSESDLSDTYLLDSPASPTGFRTDLVEFSAAWMSDISSDPSMPNRLRMELESMVSNDDDSILGTDHEHRFMLAVGRIDEHSLPTVVLDHPHHHGPTHSEWDSNVRGPSLEDSFGEVLEFENSVFQIAEQDQVQDFEILHSRGNFNRILRWTLCTTLCFMLAAILGVLLVFRHVNSAVLFVGGLVSLSVGLLVAINCM